MLIPNEMYRDIERRMMPMIRRKAARFRGHQDMDDAIQEARIVLFKALQSYDYNRQPDLERFVGVCLNNAFAGQFSKDTAQRRMPRRTVNNGDGTHSLIPMPPVTFVDEYEVSAGGGGSPELSSLHKESEGVIGSIVDDAIKTLGEREQAVLLCFVSPPPEIDLVPEDPGFNLAVAEYLGINKNMLDWSLHRVRQTLLKTMRQGEFEGHVGQRVSGPDWPHLSHSSIWLDEELLSDTITAKGLSAEVRDTLEESTQRAARWSITYDWGEALFLRLGEAAATLIMVGRFNSKSGTLFGSQYGSQQIPVPWYQKCIRVLNGT